MIITQKYNSAFDIDTEFIPTIEELLSDCIPSFNYILNYEKTSGEQTHFTYFLFFGNRTNAPIGFAQLEIEKDREHKAGFFSKFFGKKSVIPEAIKEKSVRWRMPTPFSEGIVLNPSYIKDASTKVNKIFHDFMNREDIHTQEIRLPIQYNEIAEYISKDFNQKVTESRLDCLVKNCSSYQEYLERLPSEMKQKIQMSWKFIQKDLKLKFGEYSSFKEIFQYKSKGSLQYKGLKNHPRIEALIQGESQLRYLTLETDDEIKSIVFYIPGQFEHHFYDFFSVDDSIPNLVLHQQAIVQFFESDGERLHFFNQAAKVEEFLDLGYTMRKQLFVQLRKSLHS